MALIYTNQSSKKKRLKSKRLEKARMEHKAFLQSVGVIKPKVKIVCSFPDLSVKPTYDTSNNLYVKGGYKKTVDDWKWKKDRQETAETIKEIERKKERTAPLFNKGGYQYITDAEDPKTIGRKI